MYNNRCNCMCGNSRYDSMGCPPICCPAPIVAPKKVCVSQSRACVEQPVICPIENRHIRNVVYYPRYYPTYEQSCSVRYPDGTVVPGRGADQFNTPNV